MGYYKPATICLNGHVVSYTEANFAKYCTLCGQATISECPHCHEPIHGVYKIEAVSSYSKFIREYYCSNCGKLYPWTQRIIDSAVEALSNDKSLDDETLQILKNAIPDLITETPQTQISIAKYKRYLDKADKIVKDTLYHVLIDCLCEFAKTSLFPHKPQ